MIKTFRRRFIIITVISVSVVLAIIMGSLNIYNYVKLKNDADDVITEIIENNGVFSYGDNYFGGNYFSFFFNNIPNTGIEENYFTVTMDSFGNIQQINTQNTDIVSNEDAAALAAQLYNAEKYNGFHEVYRYLATGIGNNIVYIFLDCSSELATFYNFMISSIFITLAGIALVFLLVLYFSKRAIAPISESYAKQKQFITDAGHELKTPLTIIDANTEIIEMEHGESEWTQSIRNQVSRMSSLTENLIFLSRMDEENSLMTCAPFSISDAVYETANSFTTVAETQGKPFNIEAEPNLTYRGDENSIKRLTSILLDNAFKYSTPNSEVRITLRDCGRNYELTTQNESENIAAGNLDMLFERFYRADSSRNSQTGGSGIGLSSARAIVTAHHGKIKAASPDGKTIIFTATLPKNN